MELSTLLAFLVAAPLAAALLMAVLPSRSTPRWVYETIHLLSVGLACGVGLILVVSVMTHDASVAAMGNWLRMDTLSGVFVVLIGVIGLMTGIYSLPYVRHDAEVGHMDAAHVKRYYVFFSLFVFTMLMAATSNNIIMMWASIEATTLSTVFLVGAYDTRLSLEAAWKYIVVCTAGVAFGLYGTVLVYANAADVMADPTQAVFWDAILPYADQFDHVLVQIAFVFAAVGFGTKAGLFPMHTWLPDAHSEAPSPVSGLLSGVLLKCAMLVIIRFYALAVQVVGSEFPQLVMLVLGLCSVAYAAFAVFNQNDLKRKLAYSSCENVGVVALCLGFGGPLGIAAALIHCIMHGLTKALMFCLSGNLLMKYGTRDLAKIQGVIQVAPITAVLLCVGLLGISAFPPFGMFVSEVMAFVSGIVAGKVWIVVMMGLVLTVVIAAFVKVASGSVLSRAPEGMERGDVPALALVPEVILAACVLWFGVAMPQPVLQGVESATAIVLQQDADVLHEAPLFKNIFAAVEVTDGATGE